MNDEKIEPLDIFKKGIEGSKKYYHMDFPDVTNEEIEKAINLLMNQKQINDYLRRIKKFEDSRLSKWYSNHCEICNKAYAGFGITILNRDNKEELKWYCLEHEAFGKLTAIENELEHKQDKDLDDIYKFVKEVVKSIKDKFRREYDKEYDY